MIWHKQDHSSPPLPPISLLERPIQPYPAPRIFSAAFFYYIGMFIRLNDLFLTREKCTAASGWGVGTTMAPCPSYTSCTLSVDIPRTNTMTSFDDILNDIAKETTKNTWKWSYTWARCCPQRARRFRQRGKRPKKELLICSFIKVFENIAKVDDLRFRRTSRDKCDEIVTKHKKCNYKWSSVFSDKASISLFSSNVLYIFRWLESSEVE